MQREFGVKFEIKTEILSIVNLQTGKMEGGCTEYIPLEEWLYENDIDLASYADDVMIYVKEESEGIFKPSFKDLGLFADNEIAEYSLNNKWMAQDLNRTYFGEIKVKIIMRDNKHFIDCEVENENN